MLDITSANPIVEIDHLYYWYDSSFLTLDDISFRMEQADLLGIIGPNGAGKTTLFNCILGILTDYRGTVKLFGKEVMRNRKALLSKVGYVPQHASIEQSFPATIEEIISFGLLGSIEKYSRSYAKDQVLKASARRGAHRRDAAAARGPVPVQLPAHLRRRLRRGLLLVQVGRGAQRRRLRRVRGGGPRERGRVARDRPAVSGLGARPGRQPSGHGGLQGLPRARAAQRRAAASQRLARALSGRQAPASRSQVVAVTPRARSSNFLTRCVVALRGSRRDVDVARHHELGHPRLAATRAAPRRSIARRSATSTTTITSSSPSSAGTPMAAQSATPSKRAHDGLDLEARDVLAAPADGVLQPVDEVVVAVLVVAERVAGVEPAVAPRLAPSPRACRSSRR